MASFDRRSFLGSTFGGMTALSLGRGLFGQGPTAASQAAPQAEFDSLLLTWQQDPTTTMTIQWVGPDSAADASVKFAPLGADATQTQNTNTKPFTGTDLKVFRSELTGLAPGTEYKFQIGGRSPEYRFRTMPARL
jgi:hypothetical protein